MGPVKTAIPADVEYARSVAVAAVEAAGVLLREGTTKDLDTRTKGVNGDVVTGSRPRREAPDCGAHPTRLPQPSDRCRGVRSARHRRQLLGSWAWLVDPLMASTTWPSA